METDLQYRIVILTKATEAPFLVKYMRGQNPHIDVEAALNIEDLREKIGDKASVTRLITFNVGLIVPKDILDILGPTPYNIHPGPPDYPGAHPVAFALRNNATHYGTTGHVIMEKVDSGAIVYCKQVDIAADIGRTELTDMAYYLAVEAFSVIGTHCANSDQSMAQIKQSWSGQKSTTKGYKALCTVPENATRIEIARLKRICGDDLVYRQDSGATA